MDASERESSGALPLGEGDARLASVLSGLLDPVVAIDSYGTIAFANEACRSVFGYRPDELVGENIKLLMPEPYRSEHDGYLARYRKTGQTWILGTTREFPVVRKDQSLIDCELSVSRVDLLEQEPPLFCGSFRDVSERRRAAKALADSERRFRAIFDGEFHFVGMLDTDGTLVEINRTALEKTGLGREETVGLPFRDAPFWSWCEETRNQIGDAIERARRGEFVRFEVEARTRSDESILIDFSIKPISDEDGRLLFLIAEGRDVTQLKRAQQRETAMMRAMAEIGESASILAHEIKTPISSVNLALRAVAQQLGEDEQVVLEDLVERLRKLERLMRRTLSLARPIELQLLSLDPELLLREAAETLRPLAEEAGIRLEVVVAPGCPAFDGDGQLLEEALTNLVRNAIEALESGGRVRLAAEGSPDGLCIRIDDDGPGIPQSLHSTMFRPFVSAKAGGTGLGLAITRKIVEAHGGSISAHASPLGGARFEIRLPAGSPARPARLGSPEPVPRAGRPRAKGSTKEPT